MSGYYSGCLENGQCVQTLVHVSRFDLECLDVVSGVQILAQGPDFIIPNIYHLLPPLAKSAEVTWTYFYQILLYDL